MAEKSQTELLYELNSLHQRLAERDRATALCKEGEESAQRQLAKLQAETEERIGEYRRELRQARAALGKQGQKAEQVSRVYRDAFELVCAVSGDMVFRLNEDGRIVFISHGCVRCLGCEDDELQGKWLWDLLADRTRTQVVEFLASVGPRTTSNQEWAWKRQTGPPVPTEVFCRAVPHPQTGVREILGLARPVPAGSVSSGMGSETWIASLVHEFRQPLTAIANYAHGCLQLVSDDKLEPHDLLHALEQICELTERASTLIEGLRRLALPEKRQRAAVAINGLVRATLQTLDHDLHAGLVRLDLCLGDELPLVHADRIQIDQVLVNLIRNAIEALVTTPSQDRQIRITTRALDTEVEVSVDDTGVGLTLELNRLFEPFQTTKPHGMGLGLALSRAIVLAHGGRLWATPNADRGTTFFFTLPGAL